MGSAAQADEEYQARMDAGEKIRQTMWLNRDNVVSALTGRELKHEDALTLYHLKVALECGHRTAIEGLAVALCDSFDDVLFKYVEDHQE